ncbi:MAG TPA: hypothetical protein VH063_04645 [Gaiellaceae bacterium]|nr:hypothetical protein [Gaiellaceae bacterium]
MAGWVRLAQFRKQVEAHFRFLLEHGFAGPVVDDDTVEYVAEAFSVEVIYGGHQHELVTTISAMNLRAGLSCLHVEAGLGFAQAVGGIARSRHSLEKTVRSQAVALVALLPYFAAPAFEALMTTCHGR